MARRSYYRIRGFLDPYVPHQIPHGSVRMTDLREESSISAEAPGRLQELFSLAQNISGF